MAPYQQSLALKEPYRLPDISNLPVLQQIALLRTIESHRARMLVSKLRNLCVITAQPGYMEFAALVKRGWMSKPAREQWHVATADGRIAADLLLETLWRDLRMSEVFTRQSMPDGHYRSERW